MRYPHDPPVIPVAVAPESVLAHIAFHAASEVRTHPGIAPVGSLSPRKFPVPPTSRVYPGFAVEIPMNEPDWKRVDA